MNCQEAGLNSLGIHKGPKFELLNKQWKKELNIAGDENNDLNTTLLGDLIVYTHEQGGDR